MGDMRNSYRILVKNPNGRDHLADVSVDGEILQLILEKQGRKVRTGCILFRTGTSNGLSRTQ
jgi:hypothetical protein